MSTGGTGGGSTGSNKDSDDYEKIKVSLEEKMDKKDEEIIKIEANVFQLANYYFVFQGVILTSILKDSSTTIACKYIWLPLFLSVTAGGLNLGALGIMGSKYKESLKRLDDTAKLLHAHKHKPQKALVLAQVQAAALELATQAHARAPADTDVQTLVAPAAQELADALARAALELAEAPLAQPLAQLVTSALAQANAALGQETLAHPQASASMQAETTQIPAAGRQPQAHVRVPTYSNTLALAAGAMGHALAQATQAQRLAHAHAALAKAEALTRAWEKATRSEREGLAELNKEHEMKESRRTRILELSITLLVLFGVLNLTVMIIIPCKIY